MPKTYIGNSSNLAKRCKKIYIGNSSNIAKRCKKVYVGDSNNVARLCHVDMLSTLTFYGAVGDTITFTYNGQSHTVYFDTYSYTKSYDLWLNDVYKDITFTSSKTGYSKTERVFAGQAKTVNVYPDTAAYWYGRTLSTITTESQSGGLGYVSLSFESDYLYVVGQMTSGYQYYGIGAAFKVQNANRSLTGYVVCSSQYSGYNIEYTQILNVNNQLTSWESFATSGISIPTNGDKTVAQTYSSSGDYLYIGKAFWEGSYETSQTRTFKIYAIY